MSNPFLRLFRRMALRRGRSTVPTNLLPLKKIRSATVFVDTTTGEDPTPVCRAVRQFFDYQGIPVLVLCPQKRDVNAVGRLKNRLRGSHKNPRKEDLFLSLAVSPDNFAAEYEARCSTARCKVGRFQYPGAVFDLVVTAQAGSDPSQSAAFSAIKDYLTKIR